MRVSAGRLPARVGFLVAVGFLCLLASSALSSTAAAPPPDLDPLIRNIDPSVSPCEDFFRHANGTWLKNNPVPPAERAWGLAHLVIEQVRNDLLEICNNAAAANAPKGSIEQKVGDFWAVAMDTVRIERMGIEPLLPELARIDAIKSRADLVEVIALYHTYGVHPVYGIYVTQDDKNSDAYVVLVYQGGIGLPDRDYYFLDDSTTTAIREEYPRQIERMLSLIGDGNARRSADAIMAIETRLAHSSRTLEALRDPYANYNKMAVDDLERRNPALSLKGQMRVMGLPPVDSVVVGQPEFLDRADSLFAAVPVEDWKAYLRWSLVNTFANRLNKELEFQDFKFYGMLLDGRKAQRPRWKRALDAEEGAIGELMGQIWVARHCSPATKARYEKLVDDCFAAYADRIRRLDWMSPATKEKALDKLSHVNKKVAYPDRWRDYATLEIDRDSFLANQIRVNRWWFQYRANQLGKPVDRTEWHMTPQTFNAYYSPSNVEIVLPAAVFFIPGLPDSLMDDAMLYGGAGAATICHEITHGFDDEGRLYDAKGNLRPWWAPADSAQFMTRAQALVDQFDQYVVGERNVRGKATLGENIADLGGLVIAYEAFKKTDQYRNNVSVNGLTPDQRFFLGYAFAWMESLRPEWADQLIMSDVHAPTFLRVNGPLANMPEFHAAFGVKPGDPMHRPEEKIVRIW